MGLGLSLAWLHATSALGADLGPLRAPITEIEHPRYVDAAGRALSWSEVRAISSPTDAQREVRMRRIGRTLVRTMFFSAATAEVWGTWQLARNDHWTAYLLGAQAGLTSVCAILSVTNAPQARIEDRAIVLRGANQAVMRR